MKRKVASPDHVCEVYADSGVRLSLSLLEDSVLVEGDRVSLEFLGHLLLAQAQFTDDGFQMSPKGPGSIFFKTRTSLGIYIHRLEKGSGIKGPRSRP
mgnify:CR=1 FL=1